MKTSIEFEPHHNRTLKSRQKPEVAIFEDKVDEYDAWYERHNFAYLSELAAINALLPKDAVGIEVGVATGRFAEPLGIKEGVEPSSAMREVARKRGVDVMNAKAEHLPYKDMRYDFLLMVTISYLDDVVKAFREAYRVLKRKGQIIVGFVDKDSVIGQEYIERRKEYGFYHDAQFHSVSKVLDMIKTVGFKIDATNQTLFNSLDAITNMQQFEEGFGKGSFIVIRGVKR